MKALVYAPLLACVLVVGWYLTRPPAQPVEPHTALTEPQRVALPPVSIAEAAAKPTASTPPSLRGTEVDGRLEVDAQGHLLVSEQLRDLFEYYLATVGEVTAEQAIAMIHQQLQARLTEPALSEARELLTAYLEYKQRVAELERELPVVADLDGLLAREEAVRRLRSELFDPLVRQALFGSEEQYNQYHLDRLAIVHDSTLSEAERAQALEALRESQPESLRNELAVQLHQQLGEQTRALQAEGASPEAVRRLRMELTEP